MVGLEVTLSLVQFKIKSRAALMDYISYHRVGGLEIENSVDTD